MAHSNDLFTGTIVTMDDAIWLYAVEDLPFLTGRPSTRNPNPMPTFTPFPRLDAFQRFCLFWGERAGLAWNVLRNGYADQEDDW